MRATRSPSWPSAASGDAALTGAPAARRLYREVAAQPGAPLLLDVVGVAGSGKSVFLDTLAHCFTQAGERVSRNPEDPVEPGTVLLVDDAHLLTEPVLDRLRAVARPATVAATTAATEPTEAPVRVVVAHRPWPKPSGLVALSAELAKARAPLTLGNLDRSGVAGRAAPLLDGRPPAALVDFVAEQTGGLPALVDRLLGALADDGVLTAAGPGTELPSSLVEQLYYEQDRLPRAVRELTLALAVGAPLDAEVLAPLLEVPVDEIADLVEQARSAGMLLDSGLPRPIVRGTVLRCAPSVRRLAARRRLAEIQLDRGGSVLAAARQLLDTGATGTRIAEVFTSAAEEALRADAPLAVRLLDAAIAAGAPADELAARGAEAAARAGDLDRALELADRVLARAADFSAADQARAVNVAAVALAQRGLLARSAELYRWLGAEQLGEDAVVAVPALLGTGALDEARALLEPPATNGRPSRPPTLLAGAEALLARGVYDTIVGSPTAALSQLARAAALLEPAGTNVLLPDTPAALGALVAAHCGELDVAQSVLDRAVATGLGGRSARARHQLLRAWIAMSRGATGTARTLLGEVDAGGRLEPRDELVAAALEVGLARRAGDLAALMPAWGRAREAIVRHPVDLYVLQPLGELIVASARLREQAWVRPHLDEAHDLLARLGNPVLWSVSLYWSELHSALIVEDWDEATRQAELLETAGRSSRYAEAMAKAARCWLAVLRGHVDTEAVESAARGLHAVGLSWDGGKLAGQGAIRTTDRKAMSALLACARGLQNSGADAGPSTAPGAAPTAGVRPVPDRAQSVSPGGRPGGRPERVPAGAMPGRPKVDSSRPAALAGEPAGALSDREREVAELVLDGLTYKQIGERLFISAKTVEHHVARMRQRLGSNSRGELIAQLRMIVGNSSR